MAARFIGLLMKNHNDGRWPDATLERYKRPDGTGVEVINIELKGVNHAGPKGYFATSAEIANDPEMRALNVRATQFIARITERSKDPEKLKAFLEPFLKDGRYIVDVQALTF
jgi:hypothetical protein